LRGTVSDARIPTARCLAVLAVHDRGPRRRWALFFSAAPPVDIGEVARLYLRASCRAHRWACRPPNPSGRPNDWIRPVIVDCMQGDQRGGQGSSPSPQPGHLSRRARFVLDHESSMPERIRRPHRDPLIAALMVTGHGGRDRHLLLAYAAYHVYSRTTSVPRKNSSLHTGAGRHPTDCPSLTLNFNWNLPPNSAVTTSWPCPLTRVDQRRRNGRVSRSRCHHVPRGRSHDGSPGQRQRCNSEVGRLDSNGRLRVISGHLQASDTLSPPHIAALLLRRGLTASARNSWRSCRCRCESAPLQFPSQSPEARSGGGKVSISLSSIISWIIPSRRAFRQSISD